MHKTDTPEKVASKAGLGHLPERDLVARLRERLGGPPCNPDGTYTVGNCQPDPLVTAAADEIERLRATLSRAPIAIMDTRDALALCAPTEADFQALYALQGRRVALVDLGPNVKLTG